jgi:hypothetical protein
VAPLRQLLAADARATVRFGTLPGRQLQIDFGERLVEIHNAKVKVFLFVATLGYSRRLSCAGVPVMAPRELVFPATERVCRVRRHSRGGAFSILRGPW